MVYAIRKLSLPEFKLSGNALLVHWRPLGKGMVCGDTGELPLLGLGEIHFGGNPVYQALSEVRSRRHFLTTRLLPLAQEHGEATGLPLRAAGAAQR